MDLAYTGIERILQFSVGLARSCKEDIFSGTACGEGLRELSCRGYFQSATGEQKVTQYGEIRIRLDRIIDFELRKQSSQCLEMAVDNAAVIDKQWRSVTIRQTTDGNAPDVQHAIPRVDRHHHRPSRFRNIW